MPFSGMLDTVAALMSSQWRALAAVGLGNGAKWSRGWTSWVSELGPGVGLGRSYSEGYLVGGTPRGCSSGSIKSTCARISVNFENWLLLDAGDARRSVSRTRTSLGSNNIEISSLVGPDISNVKGQLDSLRFSLRGSPFD